MGRHYTALAERFSRIGDLEGALSILGWDTAVMMPKRAAAMRPAMGATLRRLAELSPRTLALMHGPSFAGDGAAALRALADDYDRRVAGLLRAHPASMAA